MMTNSMVIDKTIFGRTMKLREALELIIIIILMISCLHSDFVCVRFAVRNLTISSKHSLRCGERKTRISFLYFDFNIEGKVNL